MKRSLAAAVCVIAFAPSLGGYALQPFHRSYWGADAVIIGRVAGSAELTVDIEIESRLRDRTHGNVSQLRAFSYREPSCIPASPYAYKVDSRYLFLMRKPYDEGAGENPYWMIVDQLELRDAPICLDALALLAERAQGECSTRVGESDLIDALKTFESCFRVGDDDKIRGSYPTNQLCSDSELEAWSTRSPFHKMLATTAKEWLHSEATPGVRGRP